MYIYVILGWAKHKKTPTSIRKIPVHILDHSTSQILVLEECSHNCMKTAHIFQPIRVLVTIPCNSSSPLRKKWPQIIAEIRTETTKFSADDPHQNQITESFFIHLIAGDLISLSVVNSEIFRDLIETLETHYQMPDKKKYYLQLFFTRHQ